MNWVEIGNRIRYQREYMGFTREQFAEAIEVTPKFCSDIELGIKGMSIPTLCRISKTLHLSADYILWGKKENKVIDRNDSLILMLENCSETERRYAEEILKTFFKAMSTRKADSL